MPREEDAGDEDEGKEGEGGDEEKGEEGEDGDDEEGGGRGGGQGKTGMMGDSDDEERDITVEERLSNAEAEVQALRKRLEATNKAHKKEVAALRKENTKLRGGGTLEAKLREKRTREAIMPKPKKKGKGRGKDSSGSNKRPGSDDEKPATRYNAAVMVAE